MDTIGRHPLTSLCVVAVLVALSLWLSIKPEQPKGVPSVPAASTFTVGEHAAVSGRVAVVTTNTPPAPDGLLPVSHPMWGIDLGREEAVCVFAVSENGVATQVGNVVTIGGRVTCVEKGRVYLTDCKLIPASKP
jgi:hypothetical protein